MKILNEACMIKRNYKEYLTSVTMRKVTCYNKCFDILIVSVFETKIANLVLGGIHRECPAKIGSYRSPPPFVRV